MEFLFIVPNNDESAFNSHLNKSLPTINGKFKCAVITDKDSSVEVKSISDKYNSSIDVIHNNDLNSSELVLIFAKEDTDILDVNIIKKLDIVFDNNRNIGVVGVSGVKTLNKDVNMYDDSNAYVGHMGISDNRPDRLNGNGYFEDIIGVNDALFAVRGSLFNDQDFIFKSGLDEGFGIDIAIKSSKLGYDVVVCDIFVVSIDGGDVSFDNINNIVNSIDDVDFPVVCGSTNTNDTHIVEVDL